MISQDREVAGYTAGGVGGRFAGACIFVQDSASHSQLLYPPGLFRGRFSFHLSEQLWIPVFLWGVHGDLPAVHSQTMDTPRGLLQSKKCVSDPFYYSSCGRNDEQRPQPSWWWAHQTQGQYTHASLVFAGHTDMPSFSVNFSRKLASISGLLLWVSSSGEDAYRFW